jgi:hypothetical protein
MYDYSDRDNTGTNNQLMEKFGMFFTVIFTSEFAFKTLAMGLYMSDNAYLQDGWNWIDFIVVLSGYVRSLILD